MRIALHKQNTGDSENEGKGEALKPHDLKKKRAKPSNRLWGQLFQEADHHCAFCPETVVESLQIHHIDEDRSNNDFKNLIMVCASCHTKITGGVIVETDVRLKKYQLGMPSKRPSGAFTADDIRAINSIPVCNDPNDPIDYDSFNLKPEDM